MGINLVPAIKELEAQIKRQEQEFLKVIEPYKNSLTQLRKLNTVCETCRGNGRVLRARACAEDDRPDPKYINDYIIYPDCKGSGKIRR